MISDKSASLSISVKDLTKRYGHVYALNNVSIDVKAGEFLTLLGPSGSGKTTLLMAIAGFNRPDSGGIYFGKQDVTILPPHKRGIGMGFQNCAYCRLHFHFWRFVVFGFSDTNFIGM